MIDEIKTVDRAGCDGENGEKRFQGNVVSSWDDKNVLDLDRGGSCTTSWSMKYYWIIHFKS